jgi:hypothetical protein
MSYQSWTFLAANSQSPFWDHLTLSDDTVNLQDVQARLPRFVNDRDDDRDDDNSGRGNARDDN